MNSNQIPQQQRQPLDLKNTSEVKCDCGCKIFAPGAFLRSVSPIVSGQKDTMYLPVEIMYCVNCFTPAKELLHPFFKDEPKIVV